MDNNVIDIPIIAITGSSGKTTTKEMISSILQRRWRIFKSIENGNDVWFTSQYAKQIDSSYQALVLEYGMTHAGNIAQHCRLIQPNIGIITNVGIAHIGNFEDQEYGVVSAKSELIKGMKSDGILFLNEDDTNSKLLDRGEFKGEVITIGILNNANYQAKEIHYRDNGMVFQVDIDGVCCPFYIPIFGKHNVYNALFAIAVSHRLGFSIYEIRLGLETYYQTFGRLTVFRLKNEITIINDTFNAKPDAMKEAIDVLDNIGEGTKIAVLGCMFDLGTYTVKAHKEIGHYAASRKVNYLYTVGKEAKIIGEAAVESGFSNENMKHFDSVDQLHKTLIGQIERKTTVLIKGYRGFENSMKLKMFDTAMFLRDYYK